MRPNREELFQAVAEGLRGPELAERFEVSKSTIYRWCSTYGIKLKMGANGEKLSKRKANHVALSEEAKSFLDGELLGDSGLAAQCPYSARIVRSCKYKEVLEWFAKELARYGIEQSGCIFRNEHVRKGNVIVVWIYKSRYYQELAAWRERFYPERKKRVPQDIRLDPVSLRQWYIGDGTIWNVKGNSSRIQLCTDAFPRQDVLFLADELSKLGFKVSYYKSRNRIIISAKSVKDFLDFIGPCPEQLEPFYGHKWKPRFLSKYFFANGALKPGKKNRLPDSKTLELPFPSGDSLLKKALGPSGKTRRCEENGTDCQGL